MRSTCDQFQPTGGGKAAIKNFVLIGQRIHPGIRALRDNGIEDDRAPQPHAGRISASFLYALLGKDDALKLARGFGLHSIRLTRPKS